VQILVDRNIPDAERAFGPFGTVHLVDGRSITHNDLTGIDALVVRSVTRVDRELLLNTPVRFVGTATIGVDHLDIPAIVSLGIEWSSAPGSNARSVMEYVVAGLLELRALGLTNLRAARLGVIGAGAVGSLVVEAGRALGMEVVVRDPPRERREPAFRSASLEEVCDVDILTLHVPLTLNEPDATYHLVDAAFLERLRTGAVILNTSRGPVVSSSALLDAIESGRVGTAVLDVWEGEPAIPTALIERTTIATPHIAGYAHDAKVRATWMLARAMSQHAGIPVDAAPSLPSAGTFPLPIADDPFDALTGAVRAAYDIRTDAAALRALLSLDTPARRSGFDHLRRHYPARREFPAWSVSGADQRARPLLQALGFVLE